MNDVNITIDDLNVIKRDLHDLSKTLALIDKYLNVFTKEYRRRIDPNVERALLISQNVQGIIETIERVNGESKSG